MMAADPPVDQVILLHGIWMRGIAMLPLAHRLRTAGFAVETFDYPSVTGDWAESARRLEQRWRRHAGGLVHVVGHSLGGMLAVQVAADHDDLPAGRVVCLGSPLNGSAAAGRMRDIPGGRWLMGQSAPVLQGGLQAWRGQREVAVIAGTTPIGLGALIGTLARPHDGTVSVDETRLAGITEHRVVAATHTGLLFSDEVAAMTAAFLRTGRFPAGQG